MIPPPSSNDSLQQLKDSILAQVRDYAAKRHASCLPGGDERKPAFRPGIDAVPYAGRVFDADEVEAAVASCLDFWLTLGSEGERLREALEQFLGVKHTVLVNSGSSANLVALTALTSHKLPAERRLRPGDEVITVAAGFPTTAAPILQNGCVPVFIDADPATGNARVDQLEQAVSPRTKAVMMAHTLGNPFDLGATLAFCRRHNLWLIEDNCDALGCTYAMPVSRARELGLDRLLRLAEQSMGPDCLPRVEDGMLVAYTGSFGDLSTQSFYPPHHLTMGEGGAVNVVADMKLKIIVESIRDWGRDCWCGSGMDDTCHKRFRWKLGDLPEGYDHKYIYSHLGYNLKPLDVQAAIGYRQMEKLPAFIEARKEHWEYLRRGLDGCGDALEFALPTHAVSWSAENGFVWDDSGDRTSCSWFGFMMTLKPDAPFTRTELALCLDEAKIGNRMLFGGNLVKQPAFVQRRKDAADGTEPFRTPVPLAGADAIMERSIFIGVYPGLSREMMDYMIGVIAGFVEAKRRA